MLLAIKGSVCWSPSTALAPRTVLAVLGERLVEGPGPPSRSPVDVKVLRGLFRDGKLMVRGLGGLDTFCSGA